MSISVCSEAEANEVITCQQYDQQCPESSDNICNDSSFPTVEISKKEELNSSLKKCVDVGNEDPVKIATAIEESVNTSKLGRCNKKRWDLGIKPYNIKVQYLIATNGIAYGTAVYVMVIKLMDHS